MEESIHKIRSIDTLKECKICKAATHCGGYCALEALNTSGNANGIHCKQAYLIISNFSKNESSRLYKRAKLLVDNTENITL